MARIRGKSICVYSPRGGVGKTTVAMNLAASAYYMKKKTILIDFDLYNGGLSLLIDEFIDKSINNISEDLSNNNYKRLNDYVYKYNEYIDLLCAPIDPRVANKFNSEYIDIILSRATQNYELVIIDMSSSLDILNLKILDASDRILFIVTNDFINLKNSRSILNIFKDNDIKNFRVLLNNSVSIKDYFSIDEIKNIIDNKIDYSVSKDGYFKDMDKILFENNIPLFFRNNKEKYNTLFEHLKLIINDLEEDKDE